VVLEDGEARARRHRNVELVDVRVRSLVDSLLHDAGVLSEQVLEAGALLLEVREVYRGVHELAAAAIDAVALLIGCARRHAVLASDVGLLLQLVDAVGEGALVAEFTGAGLAPELA